MQTVSGPKRAIAASGESTGAPSIERPPEPGIVLDEGDRRCKLGCQTTETFLWEQGRSDNDEPAFAGGVGDPHRYIARMRRNRIMIQKFEHDV